MRLICKQIFKGRQPKTLLNRIWRQFSNNSKLPTGQHFSMSKQNLAVNEKKIAEQFLEIEKQLSQLKAVAINARILAEQKIQKAKPSEVDNKKELRCNEKAANGINY